MKIEEATDAHYSNNAKTRAIFKSALLIVTLTVVFGALSYVLIQVNNAVFQLSISESMWCGLAMALVTAYYFVVKRKKKH